MPDVARDLPRHTGEYRFGYVTIHVRDFSRLGFGTGGHSTVL